LRRQQIIAFFSDREYYSRMVSVAVPIALQSFVVSALNMVSSLMIGQLGETAVAAVGLANQIFFLFTLVLFGVNSGAAMFTAQLYGKGDIRNIRRVLGLAIILGQAVALIFLIIAVVFPQVAIGVYSKDPAVIALGGDFLRVFGWSYLFVAITLSFSAILRSIGDVRTPLIVSLSALSLNALLSYCLIFGKFGLPMLGVRGAAVSILIARIVECGAIIGLTYGRRSPIAARLSEMFTLDLPFAQRVLKPVLPVALNELLWSLGITAYNVVYARIGTESIAAMNITSTIDNLALVIFIGIANACAILVGNRIGAGEEQKAFDYAGRSLSLGVIGALVMGGAILAGYPYILALYKVSPQVIDYAQHVLTIVAFLLWVRVSNLILFVGIFRSGGDTRFGLLLDAGSIWAVGVPLALLGAFVFHLPLQWVYLMIMADEVFKWVVGMWRYLSKRWIHNLNQAV